MHRINVNAASTMRYRENEKYRETKLNTASEKYQNDDMFRSKRKACSKNQYDSSLKTKEQIKDRIKFGELFEEQQ